MSKADKAAWKDFTRGVVFTIGCAGLSLLAFAIVSNHENQELKSSAEVVDTYEGCDIVRWTNHQLASNKYFLYCPENK